MTSTTLSMCYARLRRLLGCVLLGWACLPGGKLWAGGSGLNTVVVLNQSSSNSCEVANYFCERRGVPPQNVLRIQWPLGSNAWSSGDFQTNLLNPLLDLLSARQLTSQVQYVVLSMDIPFQTVNGAAVNSTTSALFYGLRTDSTSGTNSYAGSEASFEWSKPAAGTNGAFLATMLTANSVAEAKALVNQGVLSDATFPTQPVVLAKSSDPVRNIRFSQYDNVALNVAVYGACAILRTNTDVLWSGAKVLGYETGLAQFGVPAGCFAPGAIADSLTSYGGDLFDPNNSQTTLLAFISAGAAGSYGTVSEPGQDAQEFPNAQVYFYQARGFSLAESYYQSLNVPYLGLVVGEPLAAPFAQPAAGRWAGVATNTVLSGKVPLSVLFSGRDARHPLSQIDLFIDGQYSSTLTNLGPCPGNVLTLALNNYPIRYTVPTNATLASMAADLAALVNSSSNSAATRVLATAHGDRVELQSLASNYFAAPFYVPTASAQVTNNTAYRAMYVTWPLPPVLSKESWDADGSFRVGLNVPVPMPYAVLASTDLVHWASIYTNTSGSSTDFVDSAATQFSQRFYRLVGTVPLDRPRLSFVSGGTSNAFRVHIETPTLLPYVLQTSTNLQTWTAAFTNSTGGTMDFTDPQLPSQGAHFYRALVLPLTPGAPVWSLVSTPGSSGTMLRVDGAAAPYAIEIASNSGPWTFVYTNTAPGGLQTVADSSAGNGSVLSTFLAASQPGFTNIDVQGYWHYVLLSAPLNSWVQFNITKTNGASVSVAVTNGAGATLANFAAQVCAAINTNRALQGADGLVVEDFTLTGAGTPNFNLRARSPGLQAAGLSVAVKRYSLTVLPSTPVMLTNNLGDLRPRNHLYLSAGATTLGADFLLDTTTLADGFHELTAVAYEGSSVRTQSRVTVPVQVANSSLAATMTLLDLTNGAPVGGSYHIQVAANADAVSTIRLFSTGGELASATNQATASFVVDGAFLGAGLHPLYAVVDTSGGRRYRTATQCVRLVRAP